MFQDSGLSTTNYDNILIGWSQQNVQQNVLLDASTYYCLADSERQSLINNYGWTIIDLGIDPSCTASTEEIDFNQIILYPNPVSDILNIQGSSSELSIIIYNVQGKQIMKSEIFDSLDLSCLNPGIYLAEISDGINSTTKRIIKR